MNKPPGEYQETSNSSFHVDERFNRTLLSLMAHFGTPSRAHVLRKAAALLRVGQKYEQADGSVVIRGAEGRYVRVQMRRSGHAFQA